MSSAPPAELNKPKAAPPATALSHQDHRRQCLRMLAGVMISYAVDTLLLLGFARAGAIDPLVPFAYFGMGTVACLLFWLLLRVVRADGLGDPFLVLPQMAVHSAIAIGVMLWQPHVGVLMLMSLLIIHAFGAMRVSRPLVLATSVLIAVGVGAAIVFSDRVLSMPMDTPLQRTLSVLWFAMVLGRSTLLDLYGAELRDVLVERNAKLKAEFDKMHRRATRDALTGMLSRRSVMEVLEHQHRRFELTGQAFSIVLMDIDHFKQVNDTFGHPVGDDVLRLFSRRAAAELRTSDRLGRFGGEEFLAVLTATEHESDAHLAAERVRDGVAKHEWGRLVPELKVTVSLGAAVCRQDETVEQLLARADAALYEAKRAGRDCVRMG